MDKKELDHKIRGILIPAILENALLTVSSMILTAYIGRLTVNEISAFGIANRIYNIYFALFKGFSIGSMIFMARAFGKKDINLAAKLQKVSNMIVLPLSFIATLIIYNNAERFLSLMTSETELISEAKQYLRLTLLSYPLISLVHQNSAAFQANGNTRTPLVIAGVGNLLNIVLGYVLIFGFGSIQPGYLAGAAWSQNIAYLVMFLVGYILLYAKNGLFYGANSWISIEDTKNVVSIMNAGIPSAIENSFWSIAMVIMSRVILGYGQNAYAGFQLGLQGEGFCDMMSAGFLTASLSLSANAIGSEDDQLYRLAYQRLEYFVRVICVITTLFLLLCSSTALRILTDKPELIEIGTGYLLTMVWSQYPVHKQQVVFGYLRGAGYVRSPMVIKALGIWCVRVLLILLFGEVLHLDLIWIWWAMNFDQWFRECASEFFFRKKHVIDTVLQNAGS